MTQKHKKGRNLTRRDIITTVELFLEKNGYQRGTWLWQPGALLVVIGNQIKKFELKSGCSQRQLSFQLGRLATYAEVFGFKKANGIAASLNGHGWQGEALNGMPA